MGWEGAPGGEFQKGCEIDKWIMKIGEGLEKFGVDPSPGSKLKRWVQDAGFINVEEKPLPIPTGTWPKDKRLVCTPPPLPRGYTWRLDRVILEY